MFFALSKSLDVLLSPISWVLALALLALCLSVRGTSRTRRASQIAMGLLVVLVVVCSLEPVSNRLWNRLESDAKSTARADVGYDVVVLLGGLVGAEATDSWGTTDYGGAVERMLSAYDLLRKDRAKAVLISCGSTNPRAKTMESHVIADQLESWGIDRRRIIVEDRSRNTRENAVEAAKIIREQGFASVLLLTSAFHVRRASACFHAVGLNFDVMPVDYRSYDSSKFSGSILPRAASLELTTQALREMFGYWIYRAKGYAREE